MFSIFFLLYFTLFVLSSAKSPLPLFAKEGRFFNKLIVVGLFIFSIFAMLMLDVKI
jgi:hypothetical protein